jgi:hypothetical protein
VGQQTKSKRLKIAFHRYWSFQHFQFILCRFKLIPDKVYKFWIGRRHREWDSNGKVHQESYQDGWKDASSDFQGTDFYEFIKGVFEGKNVDQLFEEYRVRWWNSSRSIKS